MARRRKELIDKELADQMSVLVAKILGNWDSSTKVLAPPGCDCHKRVVARAYAQVFDFPFIDENDDLPGGALTKAELARLPALRREVRRIHPGAPRASVTAIQKLRRWSKTRPARNVGIAVGMATLFFVAFGFVAPAKVAWWFTTFPFRHPHFTWLMIRAAAGVTFFGIILVWMEMKGWLEWMKTEAPKGVPVASGVADGRYGRYAIEDFRERSPFGDASLAQKQQVAQALLGSNGGFAPTFED